MNGPEFDGRKRAAIHIGGVWASREPSVVRTVLGSCISVCLRDPIAKVGGMNHFMLPETTGDDYSSARYGVNAMEILINKCMQEGADRFRLEAKVFGGGHVLKTTSTAVGVPRRNIEFALQFLQTEGIRIVSKDIGGFAARSVFFFTDTGKVLLKRLTETGADRANFDKVRLEENQIAAPRPPAPPTDDNITLF